jgi:hypothetical protein
VAHWSIIVLLSMAAVDAGLWLLEPQVAWYVGASGVLHGIWAAGACAQLRRSHWPSAAPLLLLFARSPSSSGGRQCGAGRLPVIIDAHWYGAIGGALFALPRAIARKWL